MKISVITVAYNSAATIRDTLESVAAQDHPDIEYIVIDGASRDDTMKIVEEFRDKIAHLVSEKDRGIYDAMNKGLALATGDVICFLNSDDYYTTPHELSRVAREMADPAIDAIFGDVVFINPDNPDKIIRRYRSDRFTPSRLAWGWMPAHPAAFMRRKIYDQVGKFSTDYKIAADFEFFVRAFAKNAYAFKHVSNAFVTMRAGGASTSGLKSKILLNREVLDACRRNGLRTNIFKIASKYPMKLIEMVFH
jgi:glycosyltransferase involved in cell wall biosynthesis